MTLPSWRCLPRLEWMFGVIGRLHKLWSWADQQTTDGNAHGVTNVTARAWLDRYLCCAGFADALIAVEWLEIDEAGLRIPNFDRHNGQSGKQRAVTSKRVKKHREQCNGDVVTPSVTNGVTKALPDLKRSDQVVNTKTSLPSTPKSRTTTRRSGSRQGFNEEDLKDPEKILAYAKSRRIDISVHENRIKSLAAALTAKRGDQPGGLFVFIFDKAVNGDWSSISDDDRDEGKRWLQRLESPLRNNRRSECDDGSRKDPAEIGDSVSALLHRLGVPKTGQNPESASSPQTTQT